MENFRRKLVADAVSSSLPKVVRDFGLKAACCTNLDSDLVMLYECEKCNSLLPPNVIACPCCGDPFEEPVPLDAEIPEDWLAVEEQPEKIDSEPTAGLAAEKRLRTVSYVAPVLGIFLLSAILGAAYSYSQNEKSVAAADSQAEINQPQMEQTAQDSEQATPKSDQSQECSAIYKLILNKKGWCFSTDSDGYSTSIVGTVCNESDRTYSYLEAKFDLYDAQGGMIGTTEDTINNLAPGQIWNIKSMSLAPGIATAQFDGFQDREE